jgi:hypothetical protein
MQIAFGMSVPIPVLLLEALVFGLKLYGKQGEVGG